MCMSIWIKMVKLNKEIYFSWIIWWTQISLRCVTRLTDIIISPSSVYANEDIISCTINPWAWTQKKKKKHSELKLPWRSRSSLEWFILQTMRHTNWTHSLPHYISVCIHAWSDIMTEGRLSTDFLDCLCGCVWDVPQPPFTTLSRGY